MRIPKIFKGNSKVQPTQFMLFRSKLIFVTFTTLFGLMCVRAICIHLFSPSATSLNKIADSQYNQKITLSKYRGGIFDRRQQALAISIRMPSIFMNPRVFDPTPQEINSLTSLLGISKKELVELSKRTNYFAWVKRKVPFETGRKIEDLNINGLYQVMEPARFYPTGQSAASLLGYVGVDDVGLMGLERQFDKTLGGPSLQILHSKDARGKVFFLESKNAAPETSGDNIYLTIDKVIQEITEEALTTGINNANAKAGFAIVSDPHTGKVLALANYPTFDPNNTKRLNIEHTKNRALLNVFEPGSVIKPIIAAIAMAIGKTTPDEEHDCENGEFRIGRSVFRDSHKPPTRMLTTTDTIVHSSNVCAYKIGLKLGPERLYNELKKFGIGESLAQIDFPGESHGRIAPWQGWKEIRFANITFGQGLLTTGLELVQTFGAIANGGKLLKPYYIEKIESSNGKLKTSNSSSTIRTVLDPHTALLTRNMLGKAVETGAVNAKMAMYTAGGKTGTTQKVDPDTRAYSKTKHLASFIGITPLNDPHLVIYVQIDEPSTKVHYGAKWAAPVFKEIAEKTLKYLNVAPDKTNPQPFDHLSKKDGHNGTNRF